MDKVEKYIQDYTNNCSNECGGWNNGQYDLYYHPWLTPDDARTVAKIAKEETLKNLWKDAQGDDLPDIDREVVALQGRKVVFAHRPPEYWDGKNIDTGEITRHYPQTYDKGGWNIPGVTYWLDAPLPEGIEQLTIKDK